MALKPTILAVLAAFALSTPVWANEGHEGSHENAATSAHCDSDAHGSNQHADCSATTAGHTEGDGHTTHDADHNDGHESKSDRDAHGHSDAPHH